jgi:exonuclease III
MLVNARSLPNKINEFEILVEMQEIDIVCVTETWLNDKMPDEAIDCLGMNLCSHDRTNGAGGGVAVFINNRIPFKVRADLISKSFECIWVTIRPAWLPREILRICIACVYLPPCQTDIESFYEYFYDCYDKLCLESPNSAFIVAGDFNPTSNGFQNRCLKIHCNLKQVVKKATRGNNILDLMFTNIADFYQIPCILAPLSTSDHCIVIWKPRSYRTKGRVLKVKRRDMRQANMNAFRSALENYDWHQILQGE